MTSHLSVPFSTKKAKKDGIDVVILDTAGRLSIDQELMAELSRIDRTVSPDQVLLVDDSYNANPLSVRAAIDSLAASRHPQHLVLGSMLELGEHSIDAHAEIGCYARTRGIDSLWCVGSETLPALEAFGAGALYFDDCTAVLRQQRKKD